VTIEPVRIQISTPSTSANLGPGFDSVGVALDHRNYWTVSLVKGEEPGRCRVTEVSESEKKHAIPTNEEHLFFASWGALHERGFGPDLHRLLRESGLEVELCSQTVTPLARGLGSSAALRVASCEAYRRLTGATDRPAWEMASQLEGHPDNAGPAGLGGLFVGTCDNEGRFRAIQPPVHSCWRLVVAIPQFTLLTEKARSVLPAEVPRADVVKNLSCLPFLLEGLRTGDADYLRLGCRDRIHQQQRAALIPGYDSVTGAALERGAAASYLSGAGPTIGAFVDHRKGEETLRSVVVGMEEGFRTAGIESEVRVLLVDKDGLKVLELAPEEQIA